MIKDKHCKLMIDGGSCTNGISKATVAALGVSTWRIPEPKHLEWLNNCGMLKVTHKVHVSFTVVTMLMRLSVMYCHLRCVGCYLVDLGSMIAMLLMLGEQIHILYCMMVTSRFLSL